jgi:hypothetical protein
MTHPANVPRRPRRRDWLFFQNPSLWRTWHFLPVVRVQEGQEKQLSVLFDASHHCHRYGFSATVFLAILFLLPDTLEGFLALPKCV